MNFVRGACCVAQVKFFVCGLTQTREALTSAQSKRPLQNRNFFKKKDTVGGMTTIPDLPGSDRYTKNHGFFFPNLLSTDIAHLEPAHSPLPPFRRLGLRLGKERFDGLVTGSAVLWFSVAADFWLDWNVFWHSHVLSPLVCDVSFANGDLVWL